MLEALNSRYIIDGVPQELTPAGLLAPVLEKAPEQSLPGGTVIDESMDPAPAPILLDPSKLYGYLSAIEGVERCIPVPFAAPCTRGRIAEALIDSMWRVGNFRLDDLALTVKWIFNPGTVGDMAAFYSSVEAAADYIDALGIVLRRCVCETGPFGVRIATPFSGAPLLVDEELRPDPQSWIIYVPFDTSDYRVGGSLLAQALGQRGGMAPQLTDADYFIDCFELVRELAVDGILLSAATVGAGGIGAALKRMCCGTAGASVELSDLLSASADGGPSSPAGMLTGVGASSSRPNAATVLFSELPGVLIQVRDVDFDYIDAEFILQDVAYYPLGHPTPDGALHLASSAKTGIQTILESLMQNAEGED